MTKFIGDAIVITKAVMGELVNVSHPSRITNNYFLYYLFTNKNFVI